MFRSSTRLSSRAIIALTLSGATLSAAGAATYHRFSVSQSTGSGGATNYVQSATNSSALEGNVGTADTAYGTPFGLFGVYNATGSTFGIGVVGASTTGYGVIGESYSNTQPSILAFPGGNGMGLEATTTSSSTNPAIFSESKGSGDGIDGTVLGSTNPYYFASSGVQGDDEASQGSEYYNVGVSGITNHGEAGVYGLGLGSASAGVTGLSSYGVGVNGIGDGTATAIDATNEGTGDGVDSTSYSGEAFNGTAGNNSALALYNKSASSAYPTIQLYQASTGNMIGAGSPNGSFIVDNSGNITISGKVSSSASSRQLTENPNSDVMSYGDEVTQPTIEDVGSAHLLNGSAMVPLAADYRQTIEGSNYMVFLTPNGQSHGLYIASKSPAGFVVRENDGGRSTLAFDYRIVAQQYGEHEGRLPHFATIHPDLTKQRLAEMRSNWLDTYNASRLKLAAHMKHEAIVRAAFQHRPVPRAITANTLGVPFSKR